MKKSLLIVFVELVYLSMILEILSYSINENLFFAALAVNVVTILYGIVIALMTFKEIKNPTKNYFRQIMIVKCVLIPFFIYNFIIGVCVGIGMLNPFLFMFIFVFVLVKVIYTFILMILTSLPHAAHMLAYMKNGKIFFVEGVLFIVLDFIFVSDVISSIITYKKYKYLDENIVESD